MKPVKNFIDIITGNDSQMTVFVSVGGKNYGFHLVWNSSDTTDEIVSI